MINLVKKLMVEFLGTIIFLGVILNTGKALPIGIALASVIYFGGDISGGHFNPAVTIMMLANNKISFIEAITYIATQILGGLCILRFIKRF